jgi:hypothetical protein
MALPHEMAGSTPGGACSRLRLLFAMALCTLGCAASPRCPADGGAPWRELSSPHFVFRTDTDEQRALGTVRDLEAAWQAMRLSYPAGAEPKNLVELVIFDDAGSFHHFVHSWLNGIVLLPECETIGDRPRIGAFMSAWHDARWLTQHELSHLFVHFYYPRAPAWLDEGLSYYHETLSIEGGNLSLGWAVPLRWPPRRAATSVPLLSTLLDVDGPGFYSRNDFDFAYGAWALVHLLKNGTEQRRAAFADYLDRLSGGEEPKHAWRSAFPIEAEDALWPEYARYKRNPTVPVKRSRYAPPSVPEITVRVMKDDEVHRLWADLSSSRREKLAALDEGIQHCPTCAQLFVARARVHDDNDDPVSADADMATAVKLARGDPEVRFQVLFRMLRSPPAAKAAAPALPMEDVIKTLEGLHDAAALRLLARYFTERGDPVRAASCAARAISFDRGCACCFEAYAAAMAQDKRFPEAADAQRRAILLRSHATDLGDWRRKLEAYEKQAGAKPQP